MPKDNRAEDVKTALELQAVMQIRLNYYTDLDPGSEKSSIQIQIGSGSGSKEKTCHGDY